MKIIDLDIDGFLSGDTKIEEIALVMNPAIEVEWQYFNNQNKDITDENFESYSDYPDSVSNNAKRGIELNERVDNRCATQVGKVRAQQLANKEPISVETIKRMYSYLSRAETYYDESDTEACGTISYLLWGGLAGKRWSASKLKELGLFEFVDSAQGISVGDYVSWTYAGRGEDADRGRGQVKDIRVQGEVPIPDTDLTLTATEERPVALIETRDGKIVGQYIDGDMRVTQKPDDFSHSQIHALIEAERLGCKGTHLMGNEWHPCETHKDYEEAVKREKRSDKQMVEGVIDILLQIDNIENRAMVAIYILKDFEEEGVEYDYDLFLQRIGLFDQLNNLNIDDTIELEELLDEGYEITKMVEIDPEEIQNQYKDIFNKKGITEEQFYKLVSKPKEPSVLDSMYRLRRYVYSIGPQGGPDLIDTSRQFCRRMLGRRQLVWRFEDIQALSVQLNAEDNNRTIIPRPKGASVNCFLYAGGANCRHRWVELSLDPTDRVYNNKEVMEDNAIISMDAPGQAGSVNEPVQYGRERDPNTLREETSSTQFNKEDMIPVGFLQGVPVYSTEMEAKNKSEEMGCQGVYQEIEYRGKQCFRPCRSKNYTKFSEEHFKFQLDDEKRMIYSPAMVPGKLIPRMDEELGKYFVRFTKDAIERAAYKFLMEKRIDKTNLEHTSTKFDDIFLVESWIVGKDDKIYDYGFTKDDVPEGSWAVGYKVMNDDVWNNYVKKGLVKGLSVEGLFDMSFNSHNANEYLLEEIINIIKQTK